jgi:hypothetical protein
VLTVFYSVLPECLVIESVRVVCIPITDALRVDKLGNIVHLKAYRNTGLDCVCPQDVSSRYAMKVISEGHSTAAVQFSL